MSIRSCSCHIPQKSIMHHPRAHAPRPNTIRPYIPARSVDRRVSRIASYTLANRYSLFSCMKLVKAIRPTYHMVHKHSALYIDVTAGVRCAFHLNSFRSLPRQLILCKWNNPISDATCALHVIASTVIMVYQLYNPFISLKLTSIYTSASQRCVPLRVRR